MAASAENASSGAILGAPAVQRHAALAPERVRARLADLVRRDADVLELGVGSGELSRLLRDRGCRVVGVEDDPVSAQLAADACRRVIVGDVEVVDLAQELGDERFDAIVSVDILERVKSPHSVLAAVKGLLQPDGALVAAFRNVAHGSVRLALLDGRFPDGDAERRSQPRLRFYTFDSIRDLFEDAGYAIERVEREDVAFETSPTSNGQARFSPVAEALAGDRDALTYQFVVLARPAIGDEPHSALRRLRQLAEAKATAEAEAARLRTTVEEQQHTIDEQTEHLDALAARLDFLARREQELRTMLLDAHEQLAGGGGVATGSTSLSARRLEALVEERTAWAQRAVKDVEIRDVMIHDLQARLARFSSSPPARAYRLARRVVGLARR